LEKKEGEKLAKTLTRKSRGRKGRRRPTSTDPPWLGSSRASGAYTVEELVGRERERERELGTATKRSSPGRATRGEKRSVSGGEERVGTREESRSGEKPHCTLLY